MRKTKNIFANIDHTSVFLYLFLVFIGVTNIFASQFNEDTSSFFDLSTRYGKQILFSGLSLLTAFVILIIDWKFYFSLSYIFYFFIIILLIGVLFFGDLTGGANSWYSIGKFKLQPSEFAKFATSLALAKYYNSIHSKKLSSKDKLITYLIIAFPIILTILQNDLGTALVFISFLIVFYREGLSQYILIIAIFFSTLFVICLLVDPTIL
ncbi:MAG: rod shape-determining protein RodA, partial [Flavobacteriales bacterium]|nr:rod shape-determining protein RodA [Flavobacteriales bacterium]